MTQSRKDSSVTPVRCAALTVSDTRTMETDESGAMIRKLLEAAGHKVVDYRILPDDPVRVRQHVHNMCVPGQCEALLVSGGTGLAARDKTYEAIASELEKRLDGFGELFRMLSYQDIGAKAMLSRAVAGVCGQTLIFSMPGATGAVLLAMERLILPTLVHAADLLRGDTQH